MNRVWLILLISAIVALTIFEPQNVLIGLSTAGNKAVSLCDTRAANEIEYRFGSVTSAAKSADGRQTGVIPTIDHVVFNEVTQISL